MDTGGKSQAKLLAENMKRLRGILRITQDELAEKSNLSAGSIKLIETCNRWPRPETLELIAKALKVEVSDLLSEPVKTAPVTPTMVDLFKIIERLEQENAMLKSQIASTAQAPNDVDAKLARAIAEAKARKNPREFQKIMDDLQAVLKDCSAEERAQLKKMTENED